LKKWETTKSVAIHARGNSFMNKIAWGLARNILCIRLDYMGDVLMATPAIRALRESGDGRRITLLTSSSGAVAARMIPEIDTVIEYAAPWMKHSAEHKISEAHAADIDLDMIHLLRRREFDAAVIFTTYSQSALPAALLCQLAGIPLRLAHCRENPYHLLTNWVPDPEPQERIRHEVRRQLDLVAGIECRTANERLSFQVPQADADWAARRLLVFGVDRVLPWVLLHPGASAASRRYPPRQWAQVAAQLAGRLGFPLVFTGDESEIALVESIRNEAGVISFSVAGELDLGRLGALIAQAPVMVSSNTGPAHLAAALGTPLVDLYALTNPQHTPWQVPSRVLFDAVPCRNCYRSICPHGHHACLAQVAPVRVVNAVIELLEECDRDIEAAATQAVVLSDWLPGLPASARAAQG
jgi:lipopolysaccharide heptosyltransferase II